MSRTFAFFGGSFDPPHVGHVLAASWVLSTSAVDEILVVPTFVHPFGKPLAPFEHRLEMAKRAFADLARVKVSAVEERMGGSSYTIHTLERLREEHPDAAWRLVIGSDLVDQVPSWHEGESVPRLAPLLVVGRGGHDGGTADILMPQVSSTEVRRRFAAGETVDALVPRRVVEYVDAMGLYR